MIDLFLDAECSSKFTSPFVTILGIEGYESSSALVGENDGSNLYQLNGELFSIKKPRNGTLDGDVVYVDPKGLVAQRWIRANSKHNTLLVTERCDQLCIMCSQPPKKTHIDYFTHFKSACLLAPLDMTIGISGGEPLLYKAELLDLISTMYKARPDLSFHVLTNGQHFTKDDIELLRTPAFKRVLWGVPLYCDTSSVHDQIVAKNGAFDTLMDGLAIMAQAGLRVELRTVLLRQNFDYIRSLSMFISNKLPFLEVWAIMQLERIGFAKNRWSDQFVDHSARIHDLEAAISTACSSGIEIALYNVPTCTVSDALRPFLTQSISDWKMEFPEECKPCNSKTTCSGFFAWHNSLSEYETGGPL